MTESEIRVTFPGGLKVDAVVNGSMIRTDQPVDEGGDGTAPSPFDLFLASLATCAGFYVVAFCRERSIPTEGLEIRMLREKRPDDHLIGKIRIEINLPPGFPEKYRGSIVKVADLCTVKAHLEAPPEIETVAIPRL